MIRSMDTVFLDRARAKQEEVRTGKPASGKPEFPTNTSTVPMSKSLFKQLFSKKS